MISTKDTMTNISKLFVILMTIVILVEEIEAKGCYSFRWRYCSRVRKHSYLLADFCHIFTAYPIKEAAAHIESNTALGAKLSYSFKEKQLCSRILGLT